jgi:hypothetical protein
LLLGLAVTAQAVQLSDPAPRLGWGVRGLLPLLRERQCRHGFADYWYAYGIGFLTAEEIRLAPFHADRIPSYRLEAAASDRRCFVFYLGERSTDPEGQRFYDQVGRNALEAQLARWRAHPDRVEMTQHGPFMLAVERR